MICGLVRRGGLGSWNDNSRRPGGRNRARGNFFRRKSNFSRCLLQSKNSIIRKPTLPEPHLPHRRKKKKEFSTCKHFPLENIHVAARYSRHPSRDTHRRTFSLDRATTLRVILYLCITGQWGNPGYPLTIDSFLIQPIDF